MVSGQLQTLPDQAVSLGIPLPHGMERSRRSRSVRSRGLLRLSWCIQGKELHMRQGITGLIAGLIAGAVLAGGAAFATGGLVSAPPAPGSAMTSASDGSVTQTMSVNPTSSIDATHSPDAKPPVAAERREGARKRAQTRDQERVEDCETRAVQPASRPSDAPNGDDAPRGTVCAPTPAPNQVPVGSDPGSGDHEMGEHHAGMGHE